MNLAEYALNNRALVKFLIAVLVVGGIFSFVSMSKLEDPEIKVKQALVVTVYPGASAHKVELEVTDVLEKEIRAMGDIASVESKSMADLSIITVELTQNARHPLCATSATRARKSSCFPFCIQKNGIM